MQFEKSVFLRRVVHQLFKSNLTFSVVCVFNLQFEKSIKTSGSFTIHFSTPTSTPNLKKHPISIGCSFKFPVKVGVEESIVNAPLISLQSKSTNNAKSEARFKQSGFRIRSSWCVHNRLSNARNLNEQPILYRVSQKKKTSP
jgi:hypothetical protein